MSDQVKIVEQLRSGKPAIAFTKGTSMQPLLYEGKTHVIIEPLTSKLKPGDLPIYLRTDGIYVIHRLMKEDGESYYMLGDNNIRMESIPKDWVIGIVSKIYRKGKYISVEQKSYLIYTVCWMALAPLRIFYKKVKNKLVRLRNVKKQ